MNLRIKVVRVTGNTFHIDASQLRASEPFNKELVAFDGGLKFLFIRLSSAPEEARCSGTRIWQYPKDLISSHVLSASIVIKVERHVPFKRQSKSKLLVNVHLKVVSRH